jgi:hypothetical protein
VGELGQGGSRHAHAHDSPEQGTRYIVRTEPGELDRVMAATEAALRKRDPNRVIGKLRKMSQQKQASYAGDSVMAVTLSVSPASSSYSARLASSVSPPST